jgi:hypothetical protein
MLAARVMLALSLIASAVALPGCREQGPAEEAGEKVDEAVEEAEEEVDEAVDDLKD